MLIPVLGRAGSGKTTFVLERLLQAAKKGRVLLLVPEQFSFEMEKQVYEQMCIRDRSRPAGGGFGGCGRFYPQGKR